MNFDDAKENIQPMASGRNATILQASLMETPQELLAHRRELEKAIQHYKGDDPLEPWYTYIDWIEQSYPSGGKESGLEEVLTKCLSRFESESRYYQDRRMVKLYIKFIDSHKNPTECYQQLFNAGIGTMVADLYICWAYYYDLGGNYRKAEEIFRRGLDCRAQPFEELQEAHQHFGFTVAQRMLYKDDKDVCETATQQLQDRRMALTSLRGHKRKAGIGSVRTGAAIKHVLPGVVKVDQAGQPASSRRNERIQVLDENASPNVPPPQEAAAAEAASAKADSQQPETVVRAIIDAARNQENQIEPGPWNKAFGHKKNPAKLFGKSAKASDLGFNIHVDEPSSSSSSSLFDPIVDYERNYDKPFKYPIGFKTKNRPQAEYHTPVTIENESNPRSYPKYNKMMLYPRPNVEMQLEELRAYYWLKRRGLKTAFTERRDAVWRNGVDANMRQYPNFAKESRCKPGKLLDAYYEPERLPQLKVDFRRLYDSEKQQEFSFEELMLRGLRRYDTICETADMEETVCMPSERIQRRKSFYPAAMRRSIAVKGRTSLMPAPEEPPKRNLPQPEVAETPVAAKPPVGILKKLQSVPVEQMDKSVAPEAHAEVANETRNRVVSTQSRRLDFIAEVDDTKDEIEPSIGAASVPDPPPERETVKAAPPTATIPFEIYEDTVDRLPTVAVAAKKDSQPGGVENEPFQFKAPSLPKPPAAVTAAGPSPKLPFVIFSDESEAPQAAANPSGGIFDADETCSTQNFNIFLKSQFVSTPKATQKVAQRQFGVVLKDLAPPPMSLSPKSPTEREAVPSTPTGCVMVTPSFSPTINAKQLSTILETSEHGTTQGTTQGSGGGGSAKLTTSSSSPEFDLEGGPTMASRKTVLTHHEPMETLREQSQEMSSKLENLMDSLHVREGEEKPPRTRDLTINETAAKANQSLGGACNRSSVGSGNQSATKLPPTTPAAARFQMKEPLAAFSICEDTTEQFKRVGNFSRLDIAEDTANVLPFMRPGCFQEDKTETVPKMPLFSAGPTGEFARFQDDKTETISKMLLGAPPVIPARFEDDNAPTEPKAPLKPPPSIDADWDDMEFFGKSPPKLGAASGGLKDPLDPFDSPLMPSSVAAKRFCDKATPKMPRPAIFEDELPPQVEKAKLMDSLMPAIDDCDDLSMVMGTQPQAGDTKRPSMPKIWDDDSFMGLPSQPPAAAKANASLAKQVTRVDFDDSMVMGTQPTVAGATNAEGRLLSSSSALARQNAFTMDTSMPSIEMDQHEFSLVMGSQSLARKEQESSKLFANTKKDSFANTKKDSFASTKKDSFANTKKDSFASMTSFKAPPEAGHGVTASTAPIKDTSIRKPDLSFLNSSSIKFKDTQPSAKAEEAHFELNAATEMFSTNISMIRNSTLLVKSQQPQPPSQRDIQNESVHIKMEVPSPQSIERGDMSFGLFKAPPPVAAGQPPIQRQSIKPDPDASKLHASNRADRSATAQPKADRASSRQSHRASGDEDGDDDDFGERSIYYKTTPKTPHLRKHVWDNDFQTPPRSEYEHPEVDMNHTFQMIEHLCDDPNVNPFNADLISAFLAQIEFTNYIRQLPTCQMVGHLKSLQPSNPVTVRGIQFVAPKLIGEGAYGAVYCATEAKSGRKYALKQERPPNHWEYYICLEVRSRLLNEDIIPSYMSVEYALVANNCSVLISPFYQFGSLITVCNKVKRYTNKNVDEYVVMHLACELLDIIDNLHAIKIIHADIKADNIVLMKNLSYPSDGNVLHLIDFGVSIDMKLFKDHQTFTYVHNDYAFKCVEMREKRPWSYQLDLYGVAGVIHVLLFGKHMDIERRATGVWMPKTRFPRYFNKELWEDIFKQLLNIPDARNMPNLQGLRASLKEEIANKEKYLMTKIAEFNMALRS